jgi:hypothetical protein
MGSRRRPGFGPGLGVSVPISFGLPLIVVGLVLAITAAATDSVVFWVAATVTLAGGVLLFASGRRL